MQNTNVPESPEFNNDQKHALLLGATGATGKDLLSLLLEDNFFQRIQIFVRRNVDLKHEKLIVHVIDFEKPEQWKHLVKGDILFSCLGTTLKAAGSKEAQWKIDYDYQFQFAKAAKENNVSSYVLVSAGFASPDSPFFYAKMKGKLEVAVQALGFPKLTIFKPPVLVRKDSDRASEVAGVKAISFLNKIGLFRSQKPLPTETLAQSMINAAKTNAYGLSTFQGEQIWQCAGAK